VENPVVANAKMVLVFGDGGPIDVLRQDFLPSDPHHFGVTVQVFIGEEYSDVSDSFDLLVCSPSWFAEQVAKGAWDRFRLGGLRVIPESIAVGSGIWFMRSWSTSDLISAVQAICDKFSPGPSWGAVAARVGRLIPWEFDYKYDAAVDEGRDG
jgi:hypothetical protein